MNLQLYLNTLKQKGNLAYKYNPFHNYQTDVDLYKVETNVGSILVPKGKAVNKITGDILTKKGSVNITLIEEIVEENVVTQPEVKCTYINYINKDNIIIGGKTTKLEKPEDLGVDEWNQKLQEKLNGYNISNDIIDPEIDTDTVELFARAGSLIDLDTEQLNFDLNHPVDITVQPSYDGSVNLILNDDKNIPRLINSRFSVREKNTYEIVDRIGENDTNIYNSKTFEKDTSLYYQFEKNPQIKFLGLTDGILPVGSYCFYFTYCDADDNESDFIAETGVIPVFIGDDRNPSSIDGGIKNQNSTKGVKLRLSNLDKSYNYLRVYYIRFFADYGQNRVSELKKLSRKIPINSTLSTLIINGNETTEDLDPNIINIQRFNPQSVLTQAQCKNMLFFGNIVKNMDNYKELADCALRIIPSIDDSVKLSYVNNKYSDPNGDYGYYNVQNMYNYTGYFNEEYYRFGVVFIYQNGTLSNVYNTLGLDLKSDQNITIKEGSFSNITDNIYYRKYIPLTEDGWLNPGDFYEDKNSSKQFPNFNSKGVCRILHNNDDKTLGIKFSIPDEVVNFLKEELGIRGLFFVRQKRIPTLLGQCYLLPIDKELEAPVLKIKEGEQDKYQCETFLSQNKKSAITKVSLTVGGNILSSLMKDYKTVVNDYESRLYKYEDGGKSYISTKAYAAICPDFLLNQPYYNQIFNGGTFYLKETKTTNFVQDKTNKRFYNVEEKGDSTNTRLYEIKACSVTEEVPTAAIEDQIYRLEIGKSQEAFRFRYVKIDNGTYDAGEEEWYKKVNAGTNIVRGKYSPYVAIYSDSELNLDCIYNIYQNKDIYNITQQYLNRMNVRDAYYSICDRYNFEDLTKTSNNNYITTCYRGDCYINEFTYRLNRNFNDAALPNNDVIIDKYTWRDNYGYYDDDFSYDDDNDDYDDLNNGDKKDWSKISLSDINAVQMGSWITLKVKSSMNYALRSQDHSYVSEEALMGSPRSFYPRNKIMWRGETKLPDSYLFNDGYNALLGYKCYFGLEDVNYLKNTFSNRIQYSAISIQDSYKNNFRYSLSTYFRDYSQEYGSIQKLVGMDGYLLVVFEHAIGIAPINEKVLVGQGEGEPVFINTGNVLPEEITVISDTYGTQWGESVIKSEAGYVYGVDTIAKKIWRVKGQQLEILSDFKVNSFLNNNISLSERELYPIIGLKNVKTHYNNNKKDIMFTFYDDVYKDEEKVWNLCYNELLGQFITFYSWVPSYSENIDTMYFSFDRNSSKRLSLLQKSNSNIESNTGILLKNPILVKSNNQFKFKLIYKPKTNVLKGYNTQDNGQDIYTSIEYKNEWDEANIKFKIEKDRWGNYKNVPGNENLSQEFTYTGEINNIILLQVSAYYEYNDNNDKKYLLLSSETIAFTTKDVIEKETTTDFYLHGQSGIFDIKENVYPTFWYGEQHPFEFEFVVNDKIGLQKVFNNLILISNKAEPESFHFEIEGDNYEFSPDKRAMYFRQEATKELYQNLGSDMLFDRNYTDVRTYKNDNGDVGYANNENYYRTGETYPQYEKGLVRQVKSTIFPLYYERTDTYNEIYDKYTEMVGSRYDFKNLSGSEIKWNKNLNQFNIVTHIKNSPIDLVGVLRGNSRYKEGKWNIQIPSIIFNQKNESAWTNDIPPIVINSQNVPNDLSDTRITSDKIPNIYTRTDRDNGENQTKITNYIETGDWTYRKEAKIRDKWIKIRIRYSGKNLAIIHSLITLYNISYS